MDNLHRIWHTVKLYPGISAREIFERIKDIPQPNVSASLSQMRTRNLLRSDGTDPLRWWIAAKDFPESVKRPPPMDAARAAKRFKKPAQDDALPVIEPIEPIVSDDPEALHSAGIAAAQAAIEEAASNKRVCWTQEEIESLAEYWAFEHLRIAVGLTENGLRKITEREGHGYRPRSLTPAQARTFVSSYAKLAQEEVTRLRHEQAQVEAQESTQPHHKPQAAQQPQQAPSLPASPPQAHAAPLRDPAAPSKSLPGSFGSMFEQALSAAVGEAVSQALAGIVKSVLDDHVSTLLPMLRETTDAQLLAMEARVLDTVQEMLRGVPNYNRPLIVRTEPEQQREESNEKRQQVLIVNALPAQFQSVQRAFPDLDLRLITDRMPAEEDPDLVVSLTKFMSHPLDRSLKKKYGERYTPVNGAADSVKIAISRRLQLPLDGKSTPGTNGHAPTSAPGGFLT